MFDSPPPPKFLLLPLLTTMAREQTAGEPSSLTGKYTVATAGAAATLVVTAAGALVRHRRFDETRECTVQR